MARKLAAFTRRCEKAGAVIAALSVMAAAPAQESHHPVHISVLPASEIRKFWNVKAAQTTTFTFTYDVAAGQLGTIARAMSGPPPKLSPRSIFPQHQTNSTCWPQTNPGNTAHDCIALMTAVKALWEVGYNKAMQHYPPPVPAAGQSSVATDGLPPNNDTHAVTVIFQYTVPNSALDEAVNAGAMTQKERTALASANPPNTIHFLFPNPYVGGLHQHIAAVSAVKAIWEGDFYLLTP